MRLFVVLATVFALAGTPTVYAAKCKCGDALKEVNRVRKKRGLKPFKCDPKLAKSALAIAKYRAKHRIEGHTNSDFKWVKGTRATASGCAAWPKGDGWGSCCTYENWRRAGAAWAIGKDGKRYMHLFVR